MSTPAAPGARPAWAPVIEQIERALADWLERTDVPPAPSVPPEAPSAEGGTAAFERRLARIEAALEDAGRRSHQADAALGEVTAVLARWRERAAALKTLLPPSPPRQGRGVGGEGVGAVAPEAGERGAEAG